MRLISQDGKIDVPYDLFVIGITADNCIVAARDTIARPSEIAQGVLAKYTTEKKAIKAMEMVRKQYLDYCCNYHSQSGVFKFPADDEIEV